MSNPDALVEEYRSHEAALSVLGEDVSSALQATLSAGGLPVQFVAWRLKSPESLKRKLSRPDKTYSALWDVTDLVGIRVATYFEDSIEEVSRRIETAFNVDFRHSADKLRFTDAKKFGYRSVHYVCTAPADRSPHPQFRFEVQVRTVLQHAWAEVEHDLGYKANDVVPEVIMRRFSRVASLLEIADQEFVAIRADVHALRQSVRQALSQPGNELPIDIISLEAVARSPGVTVLDRAVADVLNKPLRDDLFFPAYLVRMLRLAGLMTTTDVLRAAEQFGQVLPTTVEAYFAFARAALGLDVGAIHEVQRGYALFFAAHLAVVRSAELGLSKVGRLARLYQELDGFDEATSLRIASGLLQALAEP